MTAVRSPSAQGREVRFAGLRFTPMTTAEATEALAGRDPSAPFTAFVTPNVEHAFLRRRDPIFAACGDTCFISTNDSRVMRRAGRLAGLELEFAPGAYVIRDLFERFVAADTPMTLIGGTPELAQSLRDAYGLTAFNQHIPPMGFIHDPAAVAEAVRYVVEHPARYVFVAMGPPQSEVFCQHVAADGRATGLGLCIGSSLLVLTGVSHPAPDWMENSGLVWLYRLVREPRRLWRRYLVRGLMGVGLCARDILAIRLGLRRAYVEA